MPLTFDFVCVGGYVDYFPCWILLILVTLTLLITWLVFSKVTPWNDRNVVRPWNNLHNLRNFSKIKLLKCRTVSWGKLHFCLFVLFSEHELVCSQHFQSDWCILYSIIWHKHSFWTNIQTPLIHSVLSSSKSSKLTEWFWNKTCMLCSFFIIYNLYFLTIYDLNIVFLTTLQCWFFLLKEP